jgi:3D (Asp-Asp-Asp) domain-containing protein
VIPMGSIVTYNGKNYVVADTGRRIKGNTINILLNSHREVYAFGVKENQTISYRK